MQQADEDRQGTIERDRQTMRHTDRLKGAGEVESKWNSTNRNAGLKGQGPHTTEQPTVPVETGLGSHTTEQPTVPVETGLGSHTTEQSTSNSSCGNKTRITHYRTVVSQLFL